MPCDIDVMALVAAIDEKLCGGRIGIGRARGAINAIDIADDGRLVLAAEFVQRLGDGELRAWQAVAGTRHRRHPRPESGHAPPAFLIRNLVVFPLTR